MKNTPGGNRLRSLRLLLNRTQLDVELDAELGSGYLQRVESGKVQHPERETLERILSALGAGYTDQRDVLELFGYIVDTPLPSKTDIQWAVSVCQAELNSAVFPAYLLDCAHRLLSWNAAFPRAFPVRAADYFQLSMLKILFDPVHGVTPLIANPDVFFPAQIRALRCEMQLFRDTPWYDVIISDMLQRPVFQRYWTQTDYSFAARPLTPLELDLPTSGRLKFRLLAEPFAQDRRFRVLYAIPADGATIQAWSI